MRCVQPPATAGWSSHIIDGHAAFGLGFLGRQARRSMGLTHPYEMAPSLGPSATLDVPEIVIQRLTQYLRALAQLLQSGVEEVRSMQVGKRLQVTTAPISKYMS